MAALSRRQFMNAAAAGAAVAVAAGASAALADEPKGPMGPAALDPEKGPAGELITSGTDWLGEAPVVDDADIAQEIDTEFLVIGIGNAGLFAARKAAELGTQVVVMEKLAEDMWSPIDCCDMGVINGDYYLAMGCEEIDPTEYSERVAAPATLTMRTPITPVSLPPVRASAPRGCAPWCPRRSLTSIRFTTAIPKAASAR